MNESQEIDMRVQEAMVRFQQLNQVKPNRLSLSRNLFNRLDKDDRIIEDHGYYLQGLPTSVRLDEDNLIVVSAETIPVIHVMGNLNHPVQKLRRL